MVIAIPTRAERVHQLTIFVAARQCSKNLCAKKKPTKTMSVIQATRIMGNATQAAAAEASTFRIGAGSGIRKPARCFIQGIDGVVSTNGQLATTVSSQRYKTEINALEPSLLAKVLALEPVSFYYKTDEERAHLQYGLIAEQVAEIMPEMVQFKDGVPETGYYQHLTPLLLGVVRDLQRALETERAERLAGEDALRQGLADVVTTLRDHNLL